VHKNFNQSSIFIVCLFLIKSYHLSFIFVRKREMKFTTERSVQSFFFIVVRSSLVLFLLCLRHRVSGEKKNQSIQQIRYNQSINQSINYRDSTRGRTSSDRQRRERGRERTEERRGGGEITNYQITLG